jgi:hypothetical protein
MADSPAEEFAKNLFSKSEKRPQSKLRLKSYLSYANLHLPSHSESPTFPDLDYPVYDETTRFNTDLDVTCTTIRSRLTKYPNQPLSTLHGGMVLRIIEYCGNLARENRRLKTEIEETRRRFEAMPQPTQIHCFSCTCGMPSLWPSSDGLFIRSIPLLTFSIQLMQS